MDWMDIATGAGLLVIFGIAGWYIISIGRSQ